MEQTFKFSNQALGALMMSLQKCLMEQSDITEILKGFDLVVNENNEIVVVNPPTVKVDTGESG